MTLRAFARSLVLVLLAPLVVLGAIGSTPALSTALSRIEASHDHHDRAAISAGHARITDARRPSEGDDRGRPVTFSLPSVPTTRTFVLGSIGIVHVSSWRETLSPSRARARLMVFLN